MVRAYYLYTGDDGNTHYKTGLIALDKVIAAKTVEFKEDPPHSSSQWHNAPTPQYVIFLAGQLEFGSKAGQPLSVGPGEVVIASDTKGSGHTWKLTNDEPWRRVYVVFEPGVEPDFIEDAPAS